MSEAILREVVSDLDALPGKLRSGAVMAQKITVTLDVRTALRVARLVADRDQLQRPVLVREVEAPISWRQQVFWSLVLAAYVQALLQPAAAALAAWVLS